jgi:3D (Asp-Asp-Asp) domain-containing protein
MKINTKTNKLILLTAILIASTATFSTFSYAKIRSPLNILGVKNAFKNVPPQKEAQLAKTLKVENNGIKYDGEFIPKTPSSNLKILTVRLTVYWARGSGTDADSRRMRSSTGYTLKQGDSIAVDPKIIPYTKEVLIPNVGLVKAVDTGSAVVSKTASGGKLPVIDVFFVNKSDAIDFANSNPKIVKVAILN